MKIIPVKIEYDFEAMNHKFKASAEHFGDRRQICYYFDDRLISKKELEEADFLTDDACICEIVQNYSRSHADVFADLFKNHADKVHLVKKTVSVKIEHSFFLVDASVVSEKGRYTISMSTNQGGDSFVGTFSAVNFSEALEKTRILVNTLEGISDELSQHISEFSNDKIMEIIQWQ